LLPLAEARSRRSASAQRCSALSDHVGVHALILAIVLADRYCLD
jgi:hypothetical protein